TSIPPLPRRGSVLRFVRGSVSQFGRQTTRPKHLAGDKAYSYRPVFTYLRNRHIRPVIPPRTGGNMGKGCARAFDPDLYRRRNVVERCVGWLKGCRSIATRHEKLAVNFAAMVKLAFMRQYLRNQAVRQDLAVGLTLSRPRPQRHTTQREMP
ncbi:transposase, partial [Microvirga sp. BT688]|uniref:transposase n=1 Tax=Microvirga sp. TaxID=1873136 RepID=UPI001682CADF|nr:transposase [Microvirga sp.]